MLLLLALPLFPAASANADHSLLFGVNAVAEFDLFAKDSTYRDLVWQRLADAGTGTVRIVASWQDIEVTAGTRDWAALDADVYRARDIGAEPLLLIVNTPGWASRNGKPTHEHPPKEENAGDYESFCKELATRYQGLVRYYEYWQEQNGSGWHATDRVDEYLPWLRRTALALKSGNPACFVSVGGLDDSGDRAIMYLEKFYEYRNEWYPGEDFYDAIALHPAATSHDSLKARLEALRKIMAENNDGAKPLWLTSYGWSVRDHSDAERAQLLNGFFDELGGSELYNIEIAAYRCIGDSAGEGAGFGLCDANLRPRNLFNVFRDHPLHGSPFHTGVSVTPAGPGELNISWKTRATAEPIVKAFSGESVLKEARSAKGTDHRAVLNELPAKADVALEFSTGDTADATTSYKLTHVLVPGEGVLNGDFENGFLGGIALGWTIEGTALCYDATLPFLNLARSGLQSQVIHARASDGMPMTSLLMGKACVKSGQRYRLTGWTVLHAGAGSISAKRRVGVDPSGDSEKATANVAWSNEVTSQDSWTEAALEFTAGAPVVTIFVEIAGDTIATDDAYVYVDDVRVEPAEIP